MSISVTSPCELLVLYKAAYESSMEAGPTTPRSVPRYRRRMGPLASLSAAGTASA